MNTDRDIGTRAAVAHAGATIGNIIDLFLPLLWSITIPATIWLLGGSDPFFNRSGREAVRFQVFTLLYSIGLFLLCIMGMTATGVTAAFGPLGHGSVAADLWFFASTSIWGAMLFFGEIALFLASVLVPLYAAKKARDGEEWAYPFVFSPRKRK